MNERSVKHDTFTLERHYNASPVQAFAAWADPAIKASWFPQAEEFEFRVGGREIVRGGPPEGPIFTSIATYQEIAKDNRIVYTITIDMGETRISVSVITVQFKPDGTGTQLTYTEQCAFFDGLDSAEAHMEGALGFLGELENVLNHAN